MLSIEGGRELTDARRGAGIFDQIMKTMDGLRERGMVFGYSATVTRRNWQMLVSDEFADLMVDKGAMLAWNFLYMPVGVDPDMSLMLTPSERNQFREGIERVRSTKALFPVDFWGDAPYVKGCIAGKHYIHINNEGWVEPCIFTHFATDNVHEVSLKELFVAVLPGNPSPAAVQPQPSHAVHADRQPASLARDHRETGAHPTHVGAEILITQLAPTSTSTQARSIASTSRSGRA